MKKLLLLILILFGCTPKIECPKCVKCPKPEKNYIERVKIQELVDIKKQVDKIANLTKVEKAVFMIFMKCYKDTLPNPYSVNNLMKWQKVTLKNIVTLNCINFLEEDGENIPMLIDVLEKVRIKL